MIINKRIIILAVLAVYANIILSQKTYKIQEVTVFGKYKEQEKVATGSKISKIDTLVLKQNQTQSMSELLDKHSVVHVKSLGQGALATASFRGTASNHTQVLWQGVSLNSASLGSFDFSQIPLFFTDEVTLYHGSTAQQSGSGALGGSVNFQSSPRSVEKPELTLLGEYGSNNTFTTGLGIRQSYGKLTLSTRGYYQQSDNDYRYLNKVYSKDPFYEKRTNADYKQGGVMQEIYYKPNDKYLLSTVLWWQYDRRSLPQSIIAVSKMDEQTRSNNYRTVVNLQMPRGKHNWDFSFANMWGDLDYFRKMGNWGEQTKNDSFSSQLKGNYRYNASRYLTVGGSMQYRYDDIKTDSYKDGKESRHTASIRGFALFKPLKRLHFDVDGTLETIDTKAYGIYNTSAKWFAIDNWLTVKATHAYNYRFPTLNDLYWYPGGNPDLKSEHGFSWDAGIECKPTIGPVSLEFDMVYYHMNISNWIMWIPLENSPVWSPVNFSKVRSQGLELTGKAKMDWGISSHHIGGNYTYAKSVDNSHRGDNVTGKQLPYIPRNKWNIYYSIELWNQTRLQYNVGYTDVRFTSADQSYYTNAFTIHDASIEQKVKLAKKHRATISLRIDNLLNTYYESTQYYPMPLRSFRIQFKYYLGI